ncbi:hypothetical protein NDN01_19850 [Sphingomonas sp. QA11]|nr:hypothetical protein [Sphingomonas sp. QA11]WCM26237.1 hypothetical protein NDN01_19850 [Sphingomonas sp. QA11]
MHDGIEDDRVEPLTDPEIEGFDVAGLEPRVRRFHPRRMMTAIFDGVRGEIDSEESIHVRDQAECQRADAASQFEHAARLPAQDFRSGVVSGGEHLAGRDRLAGSAIDPAQRVFVGCDAPIEIGIAVVEHRLPFARRPARVVGRLFRCFRGENQRHEFAALTVQHRDLGVAHLRVASQGGFDRARLDPHAVHLDLPVETAFAMETAARVESPQIARPVGAPKSGERTEPAPLAAEIPLGDGTSADRDLAPCRDGQQALAAGQRQADIVDRNADRDIRADFGAGDLVARHVDGRLGRPIDVVQGDSGFGDQAVREVGRQGLAARHDRSHGFGKRA